MKIQHLLIAGLLLSSTPVLAGEPCPASKDEVKEDVIRDPNEKCRPDLGAPAAVKFEFPSDSAKKDEPVKAETVEEKGEVKSGEKKSDESKPESVNAVPAAKRVRPETCTYSAYAWDTKKGKSTDHFTVSKPYAEVTDDERDPNVPECTICREDQVEINPRDIGINVSSIRICHVYAQQVKDALSEIAKSGDFDFEKLEGYRPGKTRGKVDKDGLRTQWSQHSYGTAIDINANHNAIYSQCTEKIVGSEKDVKSCRRGIGGAYQPEKYPRVSIVRDGTVYRVMTKFWKWGGEIEGSTKDIMHFSVTGY